MDEQLIQEAAQTFCIVPEIYQQAFKQAGADFPDELVQQIKAKPDEAVKMLQSDKGLLDGVVQIYSKYKKEIDQAVAQASQQKGLFKKGGKLDQLVNKFKGGGKQENDNQIKEGQEYFKVHPLQQGLWDRLFHSPLNRLPDEPGIERRTLDIGVDPKTGEQRYILNEDVYGNTADTDFRIQPGDTLVTQKIATRFGDAVREYGPRSDEYRQVVNRLLRTGAIDFVNRNYPATNKKK